MNMKLACIFVWVVLAIIDTALTVDAIKSRDKRLAWLRGANAALFFLLAFLNS
jgi:hypothetical protein